MGGIIIMQREVTALKVFKTLEEMYTDLFLRELELKKTLQCSNDEYDFTIHADDNNNCLVRFNANERNNYTTPTLTILEDENHLPRTFISSTDETYIANIHNLVNIYCHFQKFLELYKFMNDNYTIDIDYDNQIIIGGHSFRISNGFTLFQISYLDDKVPEVFDDTVLYPMHMSYNKARSYELTEMMLQPVEIEQLPEFLKEHFYNLFWEKTGRLKVK